MSKEFLISQSALVAFSEKDGCMRAWKFKYVDKIEFIDGKSAATEAMMKGRYFEHHVIGGTRGGGIPELTKSKAKGKEGEKLKAEKELDALIPEAKKLMNKMGITIDSVQDEVIVGDLIIHLDVKGTYEGRKVLIDLKYTETGQDDKYNGWGDPESKDPTQPTQYIYVMNLKDGVYYPFYWLVFGKSGWVKWIQTVADELTIQRHIVRLEKFRSDFKKMEKRKFPPTDDYNTCRKCFYNSMCKVKTEIPNKQIIAI